MGQLPQSISGETHIAAFETAFADKLAALDVGAVLLYLVQQLPADALDTLIDQWGLSGHGVVFTTYTDAQKRTLLRQAALVNQKRGTIWVLRYLFEAAGMPHIEIAEAVELNANRYYDGTWFYSGTIPFGFQWLWAEYAVKVYEDVATVTINAALLEAMDRPLLEFAPARCNHLDFQLIAPQAEIIRASDVLVVTFVP